ncbi:hypothetical protein EHP00_2463 [Ecytonucleospora hepatopenaei]|uniref:Uncharacterized protein n=1 Tax=Ecytonucleospora hepatopenaei TaxID=646526 RepID=A0A1W0E717_9MICR|nr:hypothetical protein EHP00_2463 [Ecytonucleospora hepatopenaei]
MDKTPMEKIANFIFPRFFIRSFLIYGILLVFYIVMSIWFISELVVLSFLLGIANVIFTIYLFVKYKLHFTVIIAPSLLLLCFLGYYAFYRKTLELSLKTFRCSAAILKHYIPGMILVSVLGAVMFIPLYLMMVVISSDIQQNKFNTVLVIMLLIYITWYMSVLKSFIDCYISSLIFTEFMEQKMLAWKHLKQQ